MPGALIFLGEKLTPLKAIGLALGIAGLLLLFNPLGFDWTNHAQVIGNLLLMAAAIAWAAAILLIRGRPWHLTPLQLAPWQLLLAGVLLCGAGLGQRGSAFVARHAGDCGDPRAITGRSASASASGRRLPLPEHCRQSTSSLSFLAVPAMGIAASAIVLGEHIDATLIGGFALILIGVALVAAADRKPR